MIEPTEAQFIAATKLGVSLAFANSPVTIARLVEIIEELQQRVQALEQKRR